MPPQLGGPSGDRPHLRTLSALGLDTGGHLGLAEGLRTQLAAAGLPHADAFPGALTPGSFSAVGLPREITALGAAPRRTGQALAPQPPGSP